MQQFFIRGQAGEILQQRIILGIQADQTLRCFRTYPSTPPITQGGNWLNRPHLASRLSPWAHQGAVQRPTSHLHLPSLEVSGASELRKDEGSSLPAKKKNNELAGWSLCFVGGPILGSFFLDLWQRPTGQTRIFMKSAEIFKDRLDDELVGQVLEINFTRKVLITGGSMVRMAIQAQDLPNQVISVLPQGTNQMYHSQNLCCYLHLEIVISVISQLYK